MTAWPEFALALGAFLATHVLPTRRGLRDRLIGWLGRRAYFALYGGVSVVVLVWLIAAAGRAPYVGLWGPSGWQRWVPVLTMPVAALLGVLGIGAGYPHSLGGRTGRFDPRAPGIAAVTRHPLLWAFSLWSLAHLVANGDLAHAILFGGFAALAFGGMAAFDRRARAAMPAAEWDAVRHATSVLSLAPLASAAWWRANRRTMARAAVIAAGVYLLLFALHEPVIGVTPAPR